MLSLFQHQLERGGPLTISHPEISRYFITAREAVELVLLASAHGVAHPKERGRIFVLDFGEPVKIIDIAKRMIELAGTDVTIEFVGLRPGEKLHEEMFDDKEERFQTDTNGVLAARPNPIDITFLNKIVDRLAEAAEDRQDDVVRENMSSILAPEMMQEDKRHPIDDKYKDKVISMDEYRDKVLFVGVRTGSQVKCILSFHLASNYKNRNQSCYAGSANKTSRPFRSKYSCYRTGYNRRKSYC